MAPSQSVSLGWFQPSPVPDVATAQTVRLMCECIERSANDPLVQAAARDAVQRFVNAPVRTGGSADLARAVWWFCRYTVQRMRHQAFKALVEAFPEKKQFIVDPVALLRMNPPAGDCSAFTMLVCALLRCLGIPYELVTVAVDQPEVFTHVYPRAVLEDGVRMALDAHAGDGPGWEVPAPEVFRRQIWDSSGSAIPDRAQAPSRLHEYRGVGDETSDAFAAYTAANPTDWSKFASEPSAPSQPSYWDQIIGNLFTTGGKIAGQVFAPTTTYTVGPHGEINYQAPAGSAVLPTSLSALGSGGLGTVLVLGGIAVVLVIVLGKSKG